MSIGAYPGETDVQRGKRRILVGYLAIGAVTRLIAALLELSDGNPEAVVDFSAGLISALALGVLARKPHWYVWVVNAALLVILIEVLAATVIDGGLVPSEMLILFGLLAVLGALIGLSIRAAFFWFLAYLLTLLLAVVLPERIEPVHVVESTLR